MNDMRKHIIYLLGLAFVISSCETDKPGMPDSTIRFNIPGLIGEQVKSGPQSEFNDGDQFGVLGYCQPQISPQDPTLNPSGGSFSWNSKKDLCTPNVFYKQAVTYRDGSCSYTPLKEWEREDYQYSFFAYYPYDGYFEVLSGEKDLGAPRVKFSLPFDGDAGSIKPGTVHDAMVTQTLDATKSAGYASLRFMHILTGLNFRINNYNATESGEPGEPVTIHSIKLSGTFYKSININFDEGFSYPDETFNATYEILTDDPGDDLIVEGQDWAMVGDDGSGNSTTVLMVSNLDKENYLGDLKLVIEYTFMGSKETSEPITRPENFVPAGGTIYTVQLNFIGDSFVLNFIVHNPDTGNSTWEDEGDSDIIFQ